MKMVIQVLTGEASPPVVPVEWPAFVWPAGGRPSDCSTSGSQGSLFSQLSL
ncbi:unnamed protein product [Linum tenue]|uniref:Uncharacterized protein n=1 Tax=Linum tenue TaxID=586396 RepID=A0AAV0IYS1_9ROSI|nr:unnamed protein product [Linum tenue]